MHVVLVTITAVQVGGAGEMVLRRVRQSCKP